MTNLPQNIKDQFFKMLEDKIPILDFEQWVYDTKELESVLSADDYFELISLNYKKSGARIEVLKIIERNVDLGEFETMKLLRLLKEAQQKNERLPYILMEFYELYCHGYTFLDDLGLGLGLRVVVPAVGNYDKEWDELLEKEKNSILENLLPELDKLLVRVIDWIENKKILLTGETNELDHYQFQDFRSDEEKKSLVITYQIIESNPDKIDVVVPRKWWQFWK